MPTRADCLPVTIRSQALPRCPQDQELLDFLDARTKAEIHQELSGTPRGLQGEADMSIYLEASQEGACGRP